MKWNIQVLDHCEWKTISGHEYATKREAVAALTQLKELNPGREMFVNRVNTTSRETYSRIIGYNFGTDNDGNDCIYNGAYWVPETGKKQYEFLYYDKGGNLVGQYLTDYKGFRELIDAYDWPKK